MPIQKDHFDIVGPLLKELEDCNFTPILVGGVALVILGSDRVTKDFDFLVSRQDSLIEDAVNIFYKYGFELVSKFNKEMQIIRTLDNPKIATIRLKMDAPDSAFFYHRKMDFKIDLLFDFPFIAKEIAERATRLKVKSYHIRVASREDLICLKEVAYADRKSASDAQDLEFLRKKVKR